MVPSGTMYLSGSPGCNRQQGYARRLDGSYRKGPESVQVQTFVVEKLRFP